MNATEPQTKPLIGQSRSNAELDTFLAEMTHDDVITLAKGLAWKLAATIEMHERGCKWEDMKFDDEKVYLRSQYELGSLMLWACA